MGRSRLNICLEAVIQIEGNIEWIRNQLHNLKIYVPMELIEKQVCEFLVKDESIIIKCNVPSNKSKLDETKFDEIFTREVVERKLYEQEFRVRLHDIFISLQIANPKCVEFKQISLFSNKRRIPTLYYNSLNTPPMLELLEEPFNSLYKTLDFIVVWEWLKKQQEFWVEVPSTNFGRFLNYVRYIYYDSGILSPLWLSMALESLLVKNQSFAKFQMAGKLYELLKDYFSREEIKKYVNRLYELRSKIAHGNLNLYRPTLIHDAMKEVEHLDNNLISNNSFGIFSVIFCLQFMITNNLNKLEFEEDISYTVKN
jgi:Apea-like HEPN